jgi:hypothetical protein
VWTCLSDAEIPMFHNWSKTSFPGAPILDVTAAITDVNCPPPSASADVQLQAAANMRARLTGLGQIWLGPTIRPDAPHPAA